MNKIRPNCFYYQFIIYTFSVKEKFSLRVLKGNADDDDIFHFTIQTRPNHFKCKYTKGTIRLC